MELILYHIIVLVQLL